MTYKQISKLLYVFSLITPMFFGDWTIGAAGLILGWMGLLSFEPFVGIPWLANLFYFGNLLYKQLDLKKKIVISISTIICALFAIGFRKLPIDEGGQTADVVIGIGFIFWIASFTVLLIGQLKEYKKAL